MTENPFTAPLAECSATSVEPNIPPEVKKKIKEATIAGAISAALTALLAIISTITGPIAGINAWAFIDVILISGLAFGIHKKSRVCAIILFTYFVGAKIYMISMAPTIGTSSLVMGVIFAYYYFQGIIGTVQYKKLLTLANVNQTT